MTEQEAQDINTLTNVTITRMRRDAHQNTPQSLTQYVADSLASIRGDTYNQTETEYITAHTIKNLVHHAKNESHDLWTKTYHRTKAQEPQKRRS